MPPQGLTLQNKNRVSDAAPAPNLVVHRPAPDALTIELSGDWRKHAEVPDLAPVERELDGGREVKVVQFEATRLAGWDSCLVALVVRCHAFCAERDIAVRGEALPEGVRRLVQLAQNAPEQKDARRTEDAPSLVHGIGKEAIDRWGGVLAVFAFLGETALAFFNLLRGRAQYRWSDAFAVMQTCGPEALGIVALINFLVGLILAFVAAVQLSQFGAAIYVADTVAIGTVREMGCLMTGIILCGRTGAAFAAQLGTMKVNEEIDALKTFGLSPVEFLVLPRMVALVLMMPLLCIFADLIGITGGFLVSIALLDVTATEYVNRTIESISLTTFLLGVVKGSFFGFLVAFTGCLRGMQCGNSAAAVGEATTAAVVAGITAIIASDGVFAVLCNALGI